VIINISSVAGFEAHRANSAYAASKGAILALTTPLARELSIYKIRVNTLAPGMFNTNMAQSINETDSKLKKLQPHLPLGRFGKPDEVAHACKFLVENEYMTGGVLRIDGGFIVPHL
jgi:NAD(P)-dependent dehydrogenase (short-subunit alcohol dehydrogenase family)